MAVNLRYFNISVSLAFKTYTKDFKHTIMARWCFRLTSEILARRMSRAPVGMRDLRELERPTDMN